MLDMIEGALPELYGIETLDDYHAYLAKLPIPWISSRTLENHQILIHAMKGELSTSLKLLERSEDLLEYFNGLTPRFHAALRAQNRLEIAQILHGWEATSVKTYKIGKYWEKTPFPLEETG